MSSCTSTRRSSEAVCSSSSSSGSAATPDTASSTRPSGWRPTGASVRPGPGTRTREFVPQIATGPTVPRLRRSPCRGGPPRTDRAHRRETREATAPRRPEGCPSRAARPGSAPRVRPRRRGFASPPCRPLPPGARSRADLRVRPGIGPPALPADRQRGPARGHRRRRGGDGSGDHQVGPRGVPGRTRPRPGNRLVRVPPGAPVAFRPASSPR